LSRIFDVLIGAFLKSEHEAKMWVQVVPGIRREGVGREGRKSREGMS
jgi:hypothetical protein